LRYEQARAELEIVEQKVRPQVEQAIRLAERAYREGNTPYVVVLETTRQLLDARLRQEQLRADLRRAGAELERSVGRRLDLPPARAPSPRAAVASRRRSDWPRGCARSSWRPTGAGGGRSRSGRSAAGWASPPTGGRLGKRGVPPGKTECRSEGS